MSNFKVNQIVLCEVRVTYFVTAETHQDALRVASKNDSPTSGDLLNGYDYEIISDLSIVKTEVTGGDDE